MQRLIFGDTMGKPRAFADIEQRVHCDACIDNITGFWALRDPQTGKVLTGSVATLSIPGPDLPLDTAKGSCPHLHKPPADP